MVINMRIFNLFLKRAFDIFVSIFLILLMLVVPIWIIVPIAIKLTSKGPVIFKQQRVGKKGKMFVMYKFRTMITEQYDSNGMEIMSEDRITKVGKILRKTSLDELPQLFNVLNGNMSVIGINNIIGATKKSLDFSRVVAV